MLLCSRAGRARRASYLLYVLATLTAPTPLRVACCAAPVRPWRAPVKLFESATPTFPKCRGREGKGDTKGADSPAREAEDERERQKGSREMGRER